MSFSLESIGIKAGGKYETIYTTMNKSGEMNAAPIGLKCVDDYAVLARIFDGSKPPDPAVLRPVLRPIPRHILR